MLTASEYLERTQNKDNKKKQATRSVEWLGGKINNCRGSVPLLASTLIHRLLHRVLCTCYCTPGHLNEQAEAALIAKQAATTSPAPAKAADDSMSSISVPTLSRYEIAPETYIEHTRKRRVREAFEAREREARAEAALIAKQAATTSPEPAKATSLPSSSSWY